MPFRKRRAFVARFPAVLFVTSMASLLACPVFGHTAQQGASGAVQYVSAQGSDAKSGLSWGTAKNTIAAAIRSCPSAGSCTINVSSLTLSEPLAVRRPDTTIQCAAGSTISTAVTRGAPITVGANDFRLADCNFRYSSGVGDTVVSVPRSVSHVTFALDAFQDYVGRPPWAGIIHLGNRSNRSAETAVTDVVITGNRFLNVDPDVINLQDDVFRVTISNNVIATDVSGISSPTINAQTPDPGSALESISITKNTISKGTHNNCIQIQNLTYNSSVIQNVTVNGNMCRLQRNAGAGAGATGYSMVGISGLVETGNVFEANGQVTSGNAPFEIVACQRATSSHNAANLGIIATPNIVAFSVIGSQRAAVRNVTLTGDSASMTLHGSSQGSCYHVYAGQNSTIDQITLSGNSCNLSGSRTTGTLRGIWIQSSRGAAVQGGALSGNNIVGSRGARVYGIQFEQDAGIISGWQVGQNQFRGTIRDVVGRQGRRP